MALKLVKQHLASSLVCQAGGDSPITLMVLAKATYPLGDEKLRSWCRKNGQAILPAPPHWRCTPATAKQVLKSELVGADATRVAPTTGLPEPIFIAITMALQRPHKGMKTGWCRERATTRVAPTTGLPEPIFIAMKGYSANCEKAFDRLTLTPRGPAARRGRLPPPQAPHTSLPAPPHEQG